MLDAGFSFEIGGVVAISEYSSHKLLPLSPRAPHSGALSTLDVLYCSFIYTSRCTVGVVGKFMCKYESLCVFPRFFR